LRFSELIAIIVVDHSFHLLEYTLDTFEFTCYEELTIPKLENTL